MRDIDISLKQACLVGAGAIGLGMLARIIYRWKLANDNGFNYRDEVAFVKSCRNNALSNAGIGHHTDPFNEFSYESTEFEWDLTSWIKVKSRVEEDPEKVKAYIFREFMALAKGSDEIKVKEIVESFYRVNRRDFENGLSNETIFKHFVFYVYREFPRDKFRMLEGMQYYVGKELKENSYLDELEGDKVDIEASKRRTELNQLYTKLVEAMQKAEPVFKAFDSATQQIIVLQKHRDYAKKLIDGTNGVKAHLEKFQRDIGSAKEEDVEGLRKKLEHNINYFNVNAATCVKEMAKANKIQQKVIQENERKEVKQNNQVKGGNTVNELLKNIKPIEFDMNRALGIKSQPQHQPHPQPQQPLEGIVNYVPADKSDEAEELMEQFQDIIDETKREVDDDAAKILDFIDDNGLENGNTIGYLSLNKILESQDVSVSDELCGGLLRNMEVTADHFEFMKNGNFRLTDKGLDYLRMARAFVYYSFSGEDKDAVENRKAWMKQHGKTGLTITEEDIEELERLYGPKERPSLAVKAVRSIAVSVRRAIAATIHEVEIGDRTIIPKYSDEKLVLNLGYKYYISPSNPIREIEDIIKNCDKLKADFSAKDGGHEKEMKLVTTDANGKQILTTGCREEMLNILTFLLKHRMLTSFIVDRCENVPDKEAKEEHEKLWGKTESPVYKITVKED